MAEQSNPVNSVSPTRSSDQGASLGKFGRFDLKRLIGEGSLCKVWLAFDPSLGQEIALKIAPANDKLERKDIVGWLHEARQAAPLAHRNIVPVIAVDHHELRPYLVFEYVPGETLASVIQKRGALKPMQAVAWMNDILEALAAAHAAGVLHLNLKPSNILIDNEGRARVTDFGVANRITEPAVQPNAPSTPLPRFGTPGYLSPEAARGEAPAQSMDVFSAGLVFAEMLSGQPMIKERDPHKAIFRITNEQLALPEEFSAEVDYDLRTILLRSLARDVVSRQPNARQYLTELGRWVKPDVVGSGADSGVDEALEILMRRMRNKGDFPALSGTVMRIQGISSSATESVASLTNEILKDVALTNKLLRLVNTPHFSRGAKISTVSRAVTLVGFTGIRNMALSIVMLEHMQDEEQMNRLKEEFLRSLMAGSIAGEMCKVRSESEDAFIGGMFQHLGRHLAEYYFPEEATRVREKMAQSRPVSEDVAALAEFGLTYEQFGLGVSKSWNLPESIQRCMRKPLGTPPLKMPSDPAERMQWVCLAANEMSDVLLHSNPGEMSNKLTEIGRRYSASMGVNPREIEAALVKAREKLVDLSSAMEIRVVAGSKAAKLLKGPEDEDPAQNTDMPVAGPTQSEQAQEMLSAGIDDINQVLAGEFKLVEVLRMILETMLRGMNFRQVIFCMRDPKTNSLVGRFGLGEGVEKVVKFFNIPIKAPTPDLFTAVSAKGADTMIGDDTDVRIADRLPVWYRKTVNAPTFLLLPLHINEAPFGLIYADRQLAGEMQLDAKQLELLRTLRNQAVTAFKQSS
jgi:eukaryotic-like serine/threonine-protein kinase